MLKCDSHCNSLEVVVAKKGGDEQQAQALIRAAKIFSGDAAEDATALTATERRLMDEIKAAHRRPSPDEIRQMARDLAAETKRKD